MPYTQYTQSQLASDISVSLRDPGNIYWATSEINDAINEGLLYYGALTSYWVERGAFTTLPKTALYDLSIAFPTLRARTYTFEQLITEIQYHLLEPPTGLLATGISPQFTINQISAALKRYRNKFVLDSRIPLTLTQGALIWDNATGQWTQYNQTWDQLPIGTVPNSSPSLGHVPLDQSVALISRATWTDALTKIVTPLRKEDLWSADSYNPLWNIEPGTPYGYTTAEIKNSELQLIPPPNASGQVNLTYVQTLNLVIESATSFAIPDEFICAIKWGTLYELLATSNPSFDPLRSQYCLERYKAAIEATKQYNSIIKVQIAGKPASLDTLYNLDAGNPKWENIYGVPSQAGCSYDIVGLSKVPNRQYGVTCDVVRSAPLPTNGDDYIQLAREDVPYLFDYCRHILSFKLGGAEFLSTMPLYDNFLSGAAQRNKLLTDKTRYLTPLFNQAKNDQTLSPAS